jgi:hypothetical protein
MAYLIFLSDPFKLKNWKNYKLYSLVFFAQQEIYYNLLII